jgi:DnaJ like chaperone protein
VRLTFAISGGVIGILSSGPKGAIFGFLIGMYFDYISERNQKEPTQDNPNNPRNHTHNQRNAPVDFQNSLLILIAAIMNADGSIMKAELDMVKTMLLRTYGEEEAKSMLLRLRDFLKQNHNLNEVCRNLRLRMSYSPRLELVHVLFRISRADGDMSASEINLIQMIATQLGISTPDYLSIKAMFVSTPNSDYQILEVNPTATEEDVKKAYRRMVMRFHPDRLLGLSESEKKTAESKFHNVQKAYDNIKRAKGWA